MIFPKRVRNYKKIGNSSVARACETLSRGLLNFMATLINMFEVKVWSHLDCWREAETTINSNKEALVIEG